MTQLALDGRAMVERSRASNLQGQLAAQKALREIEREKAAWLCEVIAVNSEKLYKLCKGNDRAILAIDTMLIEAARVSGFLDETE